MSRTTAGRGGAAAGWNQCHDIAPLIEAIWRVEGSDDVAWLAAMTVP